MLTQAGKTNRKNLILAVFGSAMLLAAFWTVVGHWVDNEQLPWLLDTPQDIRSSTGSRNATDTKSADWSPISSNTRAARFCTQQERVEQMKKVCAATPAARADKWMKPRDRATVDKKHSLLMCWMSKAGCTGFKALLLDAAGFNTTAARLGHSLMQVHSKSHLEKYGLFQLQMLKQKEMQVVIKEYFKFMLIRHPFERLLSTYRGKVVDPNSDFPGFAANTLKLAHPEVFSGNKTLSEMKAPQKIIGVPTLHEFLQWISKSGTNNDHWSMIVDACHPCAHDWSAIMRLETMEHDSKLLIDRLQPDLPYTEIPVRHSHQHQPVHDHYMKRLPEFDDVSDDVTDYFLKLYKIDMDMFGYHWDKSTKTASCLIQTENGPCC